MHCCFLTVASDCGIFRRKKLRKISLRDVGSLESIIGSGGMYKQPYEEFYLLPVSLRHQ